jgi:hypothetical protein
MTKDLPENPGREVLMITVEHAPGGSSAIHRRYASGSNPAKFLVFLIKDKGAPALVPVE